QLLFKKYPDPRVSPEPVNLSYTQNLLETFEVNNVGTDSLSCAASLPAAFQWSASEGPIEPGKRRAYHVYLSSLERLSATPANVISDYGYLECGGPLHSRFRIQLLVDKPKIKDYFSRFVETHPDVEIMEWKSAMV